MVKKNNQKIEKISVAEIKHLADLAKLKMEEKEIKKYQGQLEKILNYVAQLQEVKMEKVKACAGGHNLKNIFQEDRAEKRNLKDSQELINQSIETENGLIKIKEVFKQK